MRYVTKLSAFVLIAAIASCDADGPPTALSFDVVARAGADQVVECAGHQGTQVTLDGRASEADGGPGILQWTGPFGTATGLQPTVTLPLGRHEITLTARDIFGRTSTDVVVIQVVDTRAPEIRALSATPSALWSPNHKMRHVGVAVDVSDECDAASACRIISVASNEPVNANGDGNTEPDWRITGALTAELRSERAGPGEGRVYTITIQCTDASGNIGATRNVVVTVPHDQGKSDARIP